ncbi:MAG TPA: helix-turn-helix transcriptional regulator [Mycobacteriales bacterium]|nr:helix-turn-helix transcriptional regulator [Mycobacteriales bacterium]
MDLGKGQLDLMLLAVLEQSPAHGYAIIAALRARSDGGFDLPEGTVYPALHRLESRGWIVSTTTAVNGRRRRVYGLTSKGERALRDGRRDWERTVGQIRAVLAVAP